MNQSRVILNHFNSLDPASIFTSKDLQTALPAGVTSASLSQCLLILYRMGAAERGPITKKKIRGPRFEYMKIRSLTDEEVHDMTTWPNCIDFKQRINHVFKVAEKVTKGQDVSIADSENIVIKDDDEKTTIIIYKDKK